MLSNGISTDEKARAKEIITNSLSEEDLQEVKDMYLKYTKE